MTTTLEPSQRPATREDVVMFYHLFLRRPPESEAIIQSHLTSGLSAYGLAYEFLRCPEAVRWLVEVGSGAMHASYAAEDSEAIARIDSARLEKALNRVMQAWRNFGRTDAFYSVLSFDYYKADRLDDATISQFYDSGQSDADSFDRICRRNGLDPKRDGALLDLGAGVGRVGIHFARRYKAYLAADVSRHHLDLAEKRFALEGLSNATFFEIAKFLESDVNFDVFYSLITLQHNPPPIIYWLLDEVLKRLNPGGIAYFQVPCYLYDYKFDIDAYIDGSDAQNEFEMHPLSQKHVFELLCKNDLVPIEVLPDPRIGPIGFSFSFLAQKRSR